MVFYNYYEKLIGNCDGLIIDNGTDIDALTVKS